MVFKKNPSPWPKLPFFGIRALQLAFAVIVLGITGYFNYNLVKDGYPIPWEFVAVEVVSVLTFFNILASTIFLCCHKLGPIFMMISDGLISVVWALVFGMLARAMGKTTVEACDLVHWGNNDGITICHLYKTLFAFTILGWISHLVSFTLASTVRRRTKQHGYAPAINPANLHAQKTSYNPTSTGSRGSVATSYGAAAPSVYSAAPHYTAGKDEQYA